MNNKIELNDAQKSAAAYTQGHLQIIACAGSGKTEVISRRIAGILSNEQNISPENIVAFTFTEKAAAGLKSRIESAAGRPVDGMFIGTIHGFCRHLLQKYTAQFSDFGILDTVKNHLFISRYADKCGMTVLGLKPCLLNNALFSECIDKLIDDYDNRENWSQQQRDVLEYYKDCLYQHHYIDFSLLIFEALRQINENTDVQNYLHSIKHLIVDEYQDVDDLQEKLISAIVSYGAVLCVVGDDDQTIYRFRGSNAEHMISFSKQYPGARLIRLEQNYRSQKGIVDVAAEVISHNQRRLDKKMQSDLQSENCRITADGYADVDDEFSAIAEKIKLLHDKGVPYKEIAVLVRKGKYVHNMAEKLDAAKIPYRADSAEDFFSGQYFCRFVETLQILDSLDKKLLYQQWQGVVDDEHFSAGFRFLRRCAQGGRQRLSEIISEFCNKVDFLNDNAPDLITRKESLDGILKILDDYDEIYGDRELSYRVAGILKFLVNQAAGEYKYHNFRQISENDDAVQVMTVHKSKGLEFHSVFLPRLNRYEFPVTKAGGKHYYHVLGGVFDENKEKYSTDIDDERKLFYVALTRAKQNLFLSYTLEKQPVSDFVKEAAASPYVVINKNDLLYRPHAASPDKYVKPDYSKQNEQKAEWVEERAKKAEYWELVKRAREELYNYYYIANHFCKGIIFEYSNICKKGPEAIIDKAQELNLI